MSGFTQAQDHAFVYVFVREDLSPPQQAVQSCHAVIEATKAFDIEQLSDHPSVIILSAKDEKRLHRVRNYLVEQGIRHVHFYEPDIDDQLTALATEPIFSDRRDAFSKYQLLKDRCQDPVAERVQYARKHPDGSYFRWMGECGSSEHKVWRIEDANLFDSKEEAIWFDKESEAIPVKVCFHLGGAA